MSGNGTVRYKVLQAIRSGKLPGRPPERTWGGRGCGASCMICGQPIDADELEYELEFAAGADSEQPAGHHVHIDCFLAWETERQKLDVKRGTGKEVELSAGVAEIRLAEDECAEDVWEISGGGGPA